MLPKVERKEDEESRLLIFQLVQVPLLPPLLPLLLLLAPRKHNPIYVAVPIHSFCYLKCSCVRCSFYYLIQAVL